MKVLTLVCLILFGSYSFIDVRGEEYCTLSGTCPGAPSEPPTEPTLEATYLSEPERRFTFSTSTALTT